MTGNHLDCGLFEGQQQVDRLAHFQRRRICTHYVERSGKALGISDQFWISGWIRVVEVGGRAHEPVEIAAELQRTAEEASMKSQVRVSFMSEMNCAGLPEVAE